MFPSLYYFCFSFLRFDLFLYIDGLKYWYMEIQKKNIYLFQAYLRYLNFRNIPINSLFKLYYKVDQKTTNFFPPFLNFLGFILSEGQIRIRLKKFGSSPMLCGLFFSSVRYSLLLYNLLSVYIYIYIYTFLPGRSCLSGGISCRPQRKCLSPCVP